MAIVAAVACSRGSDDGRPARATTESLPAGVVAFRVPELGQIADTAMRRSALRGRAILEATRDSLPHNVGNALRCTSCHFAAGTVRNAMPWVGVYAQFPQYRARNGRVDLIENRINDCFERSMNGRAIDPDSREMHDIVSYLAFLSRGVPVGGAVEGQRLPKLTKLEGDTSRGGALFGPQCSRCHGDRGQGSAVAPPLWGPKSYNIGAGMARLGTLAAFVHQLMPFDKPGTLTPQQAYDIAAYVNSRPRPDFRGKENDWPFGGAPDDIAYPVKSLAAKK